MGWTRRQRAGCFAIENLAAADSAIGCWNDTYYWSFWRHITAAGEETVLFSRSGQQLNLEFLARLNCPDRDNLIAIRVR
jgi:hypothetical protein